MVVGQTLGHYTIQEKLGAGGMGEVYRAHDERLGRDVAIKVMRAEVAGNAERVRRFEREARTVASLSHPNILALYDVGSHEGQPYLVTELLEGCTLAERIRAGDLTVLKAVELGTQIAQGLAAAHEHGVVHRDLKPGNVFVATNGVVKILDFGLARLTHVEAVASDPTTISTETRLTETRTILGTFGYMAPEQARGLPADHRTDIFAFGCVLYEMLAGKRAFRGDSATDVTAAILKDDPAPLPSRVPSALDIIVRRSLEKRPEERFSSAHDLGLALAAVSTKARSEFRIDTPIGTGVARAWTAVVGSVVSTLVTVLSPLRTRPLLKLLVTLAAIGVVAIVLVSAIRQRRVAWARNQAVPELVRLVEAQEYWPAFLLARRIEAVVPDDTTLRGLRPRFAGEFKRKVLPAEAKVLARPRNTGEENWIELGEATGKPVPAPLGYSEFRVQSPGFEPREFAMSVSEFGWDDYTVKGVLVLARRDELPDGMVRIETPAKEVWFGLNSSRFDFKEAGRVASFFVDAHEVTNREYKRFVDADGYQRQEYWREPFERDGEALAWGEAMTLFRDATGRPGPSAWEVGSYPQGADDVPVTGVSWYEAAAYAAFAGKRLPSVYHAALAGARPVGGDILPGSNFSGSLAPVGSYLGSLNYWGLYDVAGNAREWCSNASGRERFVVGGAADDPAYMFWNSDTTRSPFDRDPTTGFRCIKPVAPDTEGVDLDHQIARKTPTDWEKEKPFSEDAWRTWRGLLSYANAPLQARVEWTDDTLPSWRMEKVSFNAAYGEERVVAYLFLPRNVPPPWQAVIFWPGGYAPMVSNSEDGRNTLDGSYWDYLVKDGRAVVYPILKGTFERGGHSDRVLETSMDNCILEAKDVFRSLDYLETRPDIQKDRIGYLGFSWGATAGPLVCAVEKRIKVAVLLGGGLYDRELLGFIHRCSTPTQMVNGRSDGYAENQAPMFRALATPPDRKRHVVFDSDHSLSGFRTEVVKANLEWFDRYLGPVKPGGDKEEP